MSPAEDVAALVARVRAALHFAEGRAVHVALRAQGSGMVAGLPATVTWRCHVDGRVRLEVASQLPDVSAFDGGRGTHLGPSGLLEPLDLADLDELRMASAFFTGAWLDPRTPFVFDRVTRVGDTLVVGARVGPEEWRQAFRLVCAAGSFHPQRLETLSGDGAVFEVGGFASGVFCDVSRRLTWRRGWLVDTTKVSAYSRLISTKFSVQHPAFHGKRKAGAFYQRLSATSWTRARSKSELRAGQQLVSLKLAGHRARHDTRRGRYRYYEGVIHEFTKLSASRPPGLRRMIRTLERANRAVFPAAWLEQG